MEEEDAVGELEEEAAGAVDEWEEEGAVDIVVSDSEEELEVPWVLRQPNLIQKLADVVTQRASCVIELEGGAQLTIRPATQRRRPPPPTKHLLYYPVPGWLTLTPPAPLSPDHARDSTITVAVLVLNVAARLEGLGSRDRPLSEQERESFVVLVYAITGQGGCSLHLPF